MSSFDFNFQGHTPRNKAILIAIVIYNILKPNLKAKRRAPASLREQSRLRGIVQSSPGTAVRGVRGGRVAVKVSVV